MRISALPYFPGMKRAWSAMGLLLSVHALHAQPFFFERITESDGLPNREVLALLEDRDGHIWAGTGDGLARLEGTRIRVFHHDHGDSTSLAHDQVNALAQDDNGTLWCATMSGLARFDPRSGTFRNSRIAASGAMAHQANRMRQLVAVGDSLLWIVTEAGLYRYAIAEGRFRTAQGLAPGDGPAGFIEAGHALCWDARRQTLWAGTRQGLASWDARTDRWTDHRNSTAVPWNDRSATDAPVVRGDSLWFLRNKPYTLFAFDLERRMLHAQADLEAGANLFTLRCQAFDQEGRHWLSTWTHRLFQRAGTAPWMEQRADAERAGSIASSNVADVLITRAGERWFATDAGIALVREGAQATTPLPVDLSPRTISSLLAIGTDTVLIGTHGGGIHVLDRRTGALRSYLLRIADEPKGAQEQANSIHALLAMGHGDYLVCTGRGLAEFNPATGRFVANTTLAARLPRLDERFFTTAWRDDDALWLGTWRSGLWRCGANGPCVRVDTTEGPWGRLPGRMILCALTDRNGRPWVGLNNGGGLAFAVAGRFGAITDARGANLGGVVRCLAEDEQGRIWCGTHEQGIVVHDPRDGSARYFTRKQGLPGTRILSMRFAPDGTLWAATTQGIASLPPGASAFRPFALPGDLAAQAITSILEVLPDGRLLVGIGGRLLVHDPHAASAPAPPLALFTGYRVNDMQRLGAPPALELSPARKTLSLELGTAGHGAHAPLFRYRLSAADTAWNMIGTNARIDLFDLARGDHLIQVAASADGVHWSTSYAEAMVTVLPPFYATWWFRALAALVAATLVILGFRLYLGARLRRQREAFEREQAVLSERMRIAGDMHDDLGAGLSALKLRSEMALRVERDPERREQLGALARTAGELIGSMRQIIWTMNTDQSSIADLAAYTTNYARGYCAEHGLTATIELPPSWPDIALSAEQRRNLFLVVKEGLHNVVKHANARAVRFAMRMHDGSLVMELEDDGIGLPAHAHESVGNGLRNMHKRIGALGGTWETVSAGRGACFRFRMPLGDANQGSMRAQAAAQQLRRS